MSMIAMPDPVIEALEGYNSTVVIVKNANEKIKERLEEILREKWSEAYDEVVEEEDIDDVDEAVKSEYLPDSKDDSFPLKSTMIIGTDLITEFSELYIQYCYGDFCDVDRACDAVEYSFAELKKEFPDIKYVGFAAFFWSDRRCGDTILFEISDGLSEEESLEMTNQIAGRMITNAVNDKSYSGGTTFIDCNEFLYKIAREYEFIDEDNKTELYDYLDEMKPYIGKEEFEKIMEIPDKCKENSEKG